MDKSKLLVNIMQDKLVNGVAIRGYRKGIAAATAKIVAASWLPKKMCRWKQDAQTDIFGNWWKLKFWIFRPD